MDATLPTSMRAAAIDRFGGIETLRVETLPVPEVGPDDVLIRVDTAGVAVWDAFEREGGFARMFGTEPKFPYVLGSEGAGTVVAVGERVTGFRVGERVYGMSLATSKGFYAEYASIRAEHVSRVPEKLST